MSDPELEEMLRKGEEAQERHRDLMSRRMVIRVPAEAIGRFMGLPEGYMVVATVPDRQYHGLAAVVCSPDLPVVDDAIEAEVHPQPASLMLVLDDQQRVWVRMVWPENDPTPATFHTLHSEQDTHQAQPEADIA